jgi:ABC-type multidrug transport system fused ATPase/permease subunit
LHSLFVAITVMRYNIASLDLVHKELSGDPVSADGAQELLPDRSQIAPVEFKKGLELRDVTYQYAEASEPSLRGLSLTIKPNTTIGLVGPTGCGKTTAVDVILGLLEPSKGQILLDGVEITAANRANWQSIIGYVPQTIYLADDTLANNIAFGIPADQVDMAAVRRAAEIANLADFVATNLPQGYETNIGERGVRLSGGQRQRIGIARAMYRDPAILVMDEATSALDGVTEEGVMSAINALSRQKTIVLVAHRLSTIRACDVIYQLDRGAVQTSGTYDELMEHSRWFRTAAQGTEHSGGLGATA